MNIAIISAPDDAHIPFVTNHFPPSVECIIVDPFGAIGEKDITYNFSKNKLSVIYGDKSLDDIDSVWLRKPTRTNVSRLNIPTQYYDYTESTLRRHLSPIYHHWKDAFWVSAHEAISHADQKPHQLVAAAAIGFRVPETLTTGNKERVRRFIEKHGRCVVKSQADKFPQGKMIMTTVISESDTLSYDGLAIDPMIFQQLIEPAYELRVTVVGNEVFGAKIKAADNGPFRDWRYGHIDDSFHAEPESLSKELKEKCIRLTRWFGLNFGAIDLIVDKEGQVWFLEINPNGQWAFIEEYTNQPIGKAIAELLQRQGS
ncbi:MAG: RimK protein [Candidatus Saccharibacteria bacterium]|nr:RimK protein [Candidatus Saccharibacteria bacterium]